MRVSNFYLNPSSDWTTLYVPPGAELVSASETVTYWQYEDFDASNTVNWTPMDKYLVRTGDELGVALPGARFVPLSGGGGLGGVAGFWLYRVGLTLVRAVPGGTTPEEPPMNSAYLPPETD